MSYIPTLPQGPVIDTETGYWTSEYRLFFDSLLQNLRQGVGSEGFAIPNQPQENIDIVQTGALNGTLIFNSSIVNGGTSESPNGQLYVKLADGTFHAIANV